MNVSLSTSEKRSTCDICKQTTDHEDDTLICGEWMQKANINVHYFCLLLSTHLLQRAKDTGGILGFQLIDIRAEVKAAAERECCYCKTSGASIACADCKRYFHLLCGRRNQARSEFVNEFQTYCSECDTKDEYRAELLAKPPIGVGCDICWYFIEDFQPSKVVYAPCCKLGYVHHSCMQKYALTAGYYLRCLWCRKTEFRAGVRLQSIFVPDRDADWERSKRAYGELLRVLRCDADTCRCKHGRQHNAASGKWKLHRCVNCGSYAAHKQCIPAEMTADIANFKCTICMDIEAKLPTVIDTDLNATLDPGDGEQLNSLCVRKRNASNAQDIQATEKPVSAKSLQKPLRLRSSRTCGGYFYLEIYEFDEMDFNCVGTIVLRFDPTDKRLGDRDPMTLMEISVSQNDIVRRYPDRGIYVQLDQLIAEKLAIEEDKSLNREQSTDKS